MNMMKKYILAIVLPVMAVALTCTSCRDDEFTDTIFPTDGKPYDENSATAGFDKWIYENFTLPYNTAIDYQMYLPASDLDYQLTPADYEKSVVLAQLIKHLFYDLYNGQAGDIFMKKYAPRQFHFIGSVAYSPTTGTRTLGYASGGVMITLFNVNSISANKQWNEADIEVLNHEIFHTMHHEFSHILQQTRTTPTSFRQVTPSTYEPLSWTELDSLDAHSKGFVTNYASSAVSEDFVEVLSSIITDQDGTWMHRIINGALDGVHSGEKEQILELIDSLGIDIDSPANANKDWNNFLIYEDFDEEGGHIGYSTSFSRRAYKSSNNNAVFDHRTLMDKQYNNFRDFLENFVVVDNTLETAGISAMLQKIKISTEDWYIPTFNLHVFALRHELFKRQDDLNNWFNKELQSFPLEVK